MRDTSSLAISYFQQAATCYQQARYVESIQYYLSGLRYDSSRYYIYADLAKAYEMAGKWEHALIYLDIAEKLCPDSTTVQRRIVRIHEEKKYYQTLINECNLVDTLPNDFKPTLKSENATRPQNIIECQHYKLKTEPAITTNTLWNICQLIEKAYHEVGTRLNCYPKKQIIISINNTHDFPVDTQVPNWASGIYDGNIHVNYCSDEEPELGVLYVLIRHEWTHLLVDLLTYGKCPIWLNEGLAQRIARPLLNYEKLSLQQAKKRSSLPTISDLNQPFSTLSDSERKIAYLQSAAIVNALINAGRFTYIQKLLSLIRNGIQIETALSQTYKKCDIPA